MGDFYTGLVAGLRFPLHERLKGHSSTAWRKRLERSQWMAPVDLQALQLSNLRKFLIDVALHVPFYRQRFADAGLDVNAIESVADLARLPLLTKADIRDHIDGLKSTTAGPLSRYNTGGSSGEPLIVFMGKARESHDVAAKWRATRWWGVDIGDKELVVWGSPVELSKQDRLKRLRDGVMRSHLLPAFEMSPQNLARFFDTIRTTRPAMLFGYPSSLSLIATHARQKEVGMTMLGIHVAFVTSEKLYDQQRTTISEVFGCPVLHGGAIQSNLLNTYTRIVDRGDGYCGDFVDVLTGLAVAARIPTRSWAFSFDGSGGHGHVWPEIWNRQAKAWQLAGLFNNNYVTLGDERPLSALEFRSAMKEQPTALRIQHLYGGARIGWAMEAKAWDYYRRGLPEWCQWRGTNVFSHDHAWLVRTFSKMSLPLEQLGAIAMGVSPRLVVLADPESRAAFASLRRLRWHLFVVMLIVPLGIFTAVFCWVQLRRRAWIGARVGKVREHG